MTEGQLRAWLTAYGDAYRRQDADAGAALFSPAGCYQWGPFGDLLQGREEIRAAWAKATDPDADGVEFDFEVLAVTDTIGIARWLASYTYRTRGTRLVFDGIFEIALADEGLCSSLREWWNTREEAITPSEWTALPTVMRTAGKADVTLSAPTPPRRGRFLRAV